VSKDRDLIFSISIQRYVHLGEVPLKEFLLIQTKFNKR